MATIKKETILNNANLTISINSHGAELNSIKYNGTEYLWQADPKFWARHSPVLFPIVGAVWENKYRIEGKEYHLSQHGFARDMDFALLSQTEDEVWYKLKSDIVTAEKYPYDFELCIGYKIEGKKIYVMWKVNNPTDKTIHFQIGAHPAFYYKGTSDPECKGYFKLNKTDNLQITLIKEKGCADVDHHYPVQTDADGLLPIKKDTFDKDALIFEGGQLNEVTLCAPDKSPYLKVTFSSPLVGLWAPSPTSPFVCIEPWYGRCDKTGFQGEFKDKDWMQHLEAGQTFESKYIIEIL